MVVTNWMVAMVANFVFYSCNFRFNLVTSLLSIFALLFTLQDAEVYLATIGAVAFIWLVLTLGVLECAHNNFAAAVFRNINNDGAEKLIRNLKEGVLIIDDEVGIVLFANKVAKKRLRLKEGASLRDAD